MAFDLLSALTWVQGTAWIADDGSITRPTLCLVQAASMSTFAEMRALWTACIAHYIYRDAVSDRLGRADGKANQRYLRRYVAITVVLPAISGAIVTARGVWGNATLWCWITDVDVGLLVFYLPLVLSWGFCVVVLLRTRRRLHARVQLARQKGLDDVAMMHTRVVRSLGAFIGAFIFIYFWALLNRSVQHFSGTVVPALGLLHAFFLPLAGFTNAVIMICGGSLWRCCKRLAGQKQDPLFLATSGHLLASTHARLPRRFESANAAPDARTGVVVEPLSASVRLYCGTWNMGECKVPSPEALMAWLPPVADARSCGVLALGVQECMHLQELRAVLKLAVGRWFAARDGATGPDATDKRNARRFALFESAIGNTLMHGHMALFVFLDARQMRSGALECTGAAEQRAVKRGVNLGQWVGRRGQRDAGSVTTRRRNHAASQPRLHTPKRPTRSHTHAPTHSRTHAPTPRRWRQGSRGRRTRAAWGCPCAWATSDSRSPRDTWRATARGSRSCRSGCTTATAC